MTKNDKNLFETAGDQHMILLSLHILWFVIVK